METTLVQHVFPGHTQVNNKGKVSWQVGLLAEHHLIQKWESIPFDGFRAVFEEKAGINWAQVAKLFKEYGTALSIPYCSAVMYAEEDNQLSWCLRLLEEHFVKDLSYQCLEQRGRLILGDTTQNRSHAFIEQEIIKVLRPHFFQA